MKLCIYIISFQIPRPYIKYLICDRKIVMLSVIWYVRNFFKELIEKNLNLLHMQKLKIKLSFHISILLPYIMP